LFADSHSVSSIDFSFNIFFAILFFLRMFFMGYKVMKILMIIRKNATNFFMIIRNCTTTQENAPKGQYAHSPGQRPGCMDIMVTTP
jgi:hypothetical protein